MIYFLSSLKYISKPITMKFIRFMFIFYIVRISFIIFILKLYFLIIKFSLNIVEILIQKKTVDNFFNIICQQSEK